MHANQTSDGRCISRPLSVLRCAAYRSLTSAQNDRFWEPMRVRGSAARTGTPTGLLRQYFPKATSIAAFTQEQLDEIAAKLTAALHRP
jgi:hypothetical protein